VSKKITTLSLIIGLASFFAALFIQSNYITGWHNIIIIAALLAFTVASLKVGIRNINKQMALLQNDANLLRSRIIAKISHDFKTPLTSIIGYTQCVLGGYDGEINSEQKADLERVINNAKNLSLLVDDVVDLAKVETGRAELSPSVFSLSECITEVIANLKTVAEGNASQFKIDIPDDLPPVLADSAKVRGVLLNLIQNSPGYFREGIVTISAREFDQYYAQVIISSTGGKPVSVAPPHTQVWGYGVGEVVSGESPITANVFGAPLTNHRGHEWGLILAQKLVFLHTGSIHVESNPENGTEAVFFTLPLATSELRKYIGDDLNERLNDKQREIASKIYGWLGN